MKEFTSFEKKVILEAHNIYIGIFEFAISNLMLFEDKEKETALRIASARTGANLEDLRGFVNGDICLFPKEYVA